jgi:hypothetical protein
MIRKKSTSIVFSNTVQAIKEKWDFLGLKELVSVGLILFDRLDDKERMNLIKKIREDEKQEKLAKKLGQNKTADMLNTSVKIMLHLGDEEYHSTAKLLDPESQSLMNSLRENLGPEERKLNKEHKNR